MRCTVTKLARECVGLCPLSWFVRERNRGYYIAARRYEIFLQVFARKLMWHFIDVYIIIRVITQ